jgi:3-methyl-2-oxobutanoate hydroxymethyltransferase
MLTAYDFQTAQIFDEAGVPIIFIGDTLGIFMLGFPTTIPVTMDAMVHHCQAVSRAVKQALIIGDLPFGGDATVELGMRNASRLIQQGGVHAVKIEGPKLDLIEHLTSSGIPVMSHLGLTPQSFHQFGGNRVQARSESMVERLISSAVAVEQAGAFALVLEAVPDEAGRRVTERLAIPTIGIGAGPHCDGQVLVSTELLGISAGPSPRYVRKYAELRPQISQAAQAFAADVATGAYPGPEESYHWSIREG